MVELDYNPEVGEFVEVFGQEGLFEVVGRVAGDGGSYLLKLKRLQDGKLMDAHPIMTDYPSIEKVRRKLSQMLSDARFLPEDFQNGRFDAKTEEMYDGTPRIMVYFYLKPEVVPSVSKARIWNEFYSKLQEKLQPLTDAGTWLQFTAREDRGALRVAS